MKNSSLIIKHKRNWTFLLIVSMASVFCGQNETTNWYFGNGELSFTASPPIPTFNSNMLAPKGCASISDNNGNLLFYTHGDIIWNASHQVMSNGTGLNGNIWSIQSALILKQPGSQHLYYVFSQNGTLGNLGAYVQKGLRYAIVDMNLAAGQGSVIVKNVPVDTTASLQKLAGTNHCNGQDAWIMTHELNSNKFKAYLLTAAGLNTVPVVSSVGESGIHSTLGQMKFSPNGKKLGYCSTYSFGVFDFDNSTGVVSNYLSLNSNYYSVGCEFSPDGTKFYGAATNHGALPSRIFQWDLCSGSNSEIIASKYEFNHIHAQTFGTMQLAKDGKIYIGGVFYTLGMYTGNGLCVIQSPNSNGANCNPVIDTTSLYAFVVGGGALPNFNSSFFNPPNATPSFSIAVNQNCGQLNVKLEQSQPAFGCRGSGNRVNAVQWNFGDPGSGTANTSTLSEPSHAYTNTGTYTVTAIIQHDCRTDTVFKTVVVNHLIPPSISISGPLSTRCKGETVTLFATGADTYSWSNGSVNSVMTETLNFTQNFTVTGTNTVTQCYSSASFLVMVSPCVGISYLEEISEIRVYPNPATDVLNIETTQDVIGELTLIDALGKTMIRKNTNQRNLEIDISQLETGVYFLTIHSTSSFKKIIRIVKL